ncbi:sugar phosphate isomerase/epimerase family protein [Spirillospora sp. CA-294931]|uniref:sugar phosphate isomerase/epimerase family protein n=1 Tax=Spirillospora sp. CA-294931 TaxID=3240042 RepID=UPI003D91D2F3
MTRRRLAFSTLGCPGAGLDEIVELARSSGWRAVELRASEEDPVTTALGVGERARIRARFAAAGVTIACVASYVRAGDPSIGDRECVDALLAHRELARDLGAAAVRVFPGAGEAGPEADERAARRLRAAAGPGAVLLLETHDSHPGARDVARLLRLASSPDVGAIWDVLHTWLAGETPAESEGALGPWLRHVQLKDVAGRSDRTPIHLGTGVLPLRDVLAVLDGRGYDGFLSLEWERRWHPAAAPLPEALARARAWLDGTDG